MNDLDSLIISLNEKAEQIKRLYSGNKLNDILKRHIDKVNNTIKGRVGSKTVKVWNKKKHKYRTFTISDFVQQYTNNSSNRSKGRVGIVYLNFLLRFQQKGINQYVTYNRERRYKDKTLNDVVTRKHIIAKKVYLTTEDCQRFYMEFIADLEYALRL